MFVKNFMVLLKSRQKIISESYRTKVVYGICVNKFPWLDLFAYIWKQYNDC